MRDNPEIWVDLLMVTTISDSEINLISQKSIYLDNDDQLWFAGLVWQQSDLIRGRDAARLNWVNCHLLIIEWLTVDRDVLDQPTAHSAQHYSGPQSPIN